MPNVRDIAKLCHVSVGTVSRVLNNSEHVKNETRERVLAAMRELNYDPLDNAPAVQRINVETFGLVLPVRNTGNPGSHYNRAINAFSSNLEKYGKRCVLLNQSQFEQTVLKENKNPRTALGVDKVILIGMQQPLLDRLLTALKQWRMPVAVVRRASAVPGIPCISDDDAKAMDKALGHLYGLGHRRIAFANIAIPSLSPRNRVFRTFAEDHGLPVDEGFEHLLSEGKERFEDWIGACVRERQVTAFLAGDDEVAIHIMKVCRVLGVSVPGDVSVMSIGGTNLTALFVPAITTVRVPVEKLIELAVVLLNGSDDWNPDEPYAMEIPNELIVRETTGRPGRGPADTA